MTSWTSAALALVQIVLLFTQVLNVEHWDIKECSLDSVAGETCYLHLDHVRPGQLAVGQLEVLEKAGWETLNSQQLAAKRWAKQPPLVVGPRGFQLVDNHHHARSLFDSALPNSEKWLYFRIHRNWSQLSLDRYDLAMFSATFVWPYDEKGLGPIDPALFPRSLGDLLDDPFRSLAYMVRAAGAFQAVHLPFQEFRWANYLRDHLQADLLSFQRPAPGNERWCRVRPYSTACLPLEAQRAALEALLPRAIQLATSDQAAHLPGFVGVIDETVAAAALDSTPALADDAMIPETLGGRSLVNNHTKREKPQHEQLLSSAAAAAATVRAWDYSAE